MIISHYFCLYKMSSILFGRTENLNTWLQHNFCFSQHTISTAYGIFTYTRPGTKILYILFPGLFSFWTELCACVTTRLEILHTFQKRGRGRQVYYRFLDNNNVGFFFARAHLVYLPVVITRGGGGSKPSFSSRSYGGSQPRTHSRCWWWFATNM